MSSVFWTQPECFELRIIGTSFEHIRKVMFDDKISFSVWFIPSKLGEWQLISSQRTAAASQPNDATERQIQKGRSVQTLNKWYLMCMYGSASITWDISIILMRPLNYGTRGLKPWPLLRVTGCNLPDPAYGTKRFKKLFPALGLPSLSFALSTLIRLVPMSTGWLRVMDKGFAAQWDCTLKLPAGICFFFFPSSNFV